MKQTRCNAIMNDVKSAARKGVKLLRANHLIFNPKKEYSKFLKPPSDHPNQRLVYMLMQQDDRDCNDKVGYTWFLLKRYPHLQSLSPEEFATSVVVLFYEGMLDYAVDTELGTIVDDLVTQIVTNIEEAPKYIRTSTIPQEKKAVFLRFFKVPGTIFITTVSKKNVWKKVSTTMVDFNNKVLND